MGWAEVLIVTLLGLVLVGVVLVARRSALRDRTVPRHDHTRVTGEVAEPIEPSRLPQPGGQIPAATASATTPEANVSAAEPTAPVATQTAPIQTAPTETLAAQESAVRHEAALRQLEEERRAALALRAQLDAREERLGSREQRLEDESRLLAARAEAVTREQAAAEQQRIDLAKIQSAADAELARISGLDQASARAEVLARTEREARLEASALVRTIEREARQEGDRRARQIIVSSIQRLAAEQTAESVITAVDLPSEDMKGRIIGREGRNIRAFEQITGVNLLIDDTPEVVLLSAFDPVRRESARVTLVELVRDGRIHPQRIEEVHARSERSITERCQRAGEDALVEVGIVDLHPDLVPVLGSLQYRTSYGQNVLKHLVECAHLASMMASELGLDPTLAKRGAFLHDIGKALTHTAEGSHALVGAELARKHGEHPDVVHAIEAHHNEVEPVTVEALLTQAADAISGSRPAARREALEAYVQRMEKLERLAMDHEGVDRVFAMQAGREVRVMVVPEVVDDAGSQLMAKEIAREITRELTFPGQIRVTVVRESRATEIAH